MALEFSIGIHLNGVYYDSFVTQNEKEKIVFDKPGTYYVYGSAFNSKGFIENSIPLWFEVYDSAPKQSIITVDKVECSVGDTITFNVKSDTATAYSIGIYKNDERYDSIWDFTEEKYEYLLKEAGEYSAYVTSYNSFGYKDSERVFFIVKEKSIVGDCNNDRKFNISDVVMLQKWLLNDGTELTNWQSADLDENGIIDIFDLCLMKQKLILINE